MAKQRRSAVKTAGNSSIRPDVEASEDQNARQTVIMFVDIVGASEVSNHQTLGNYAKFVGEFQKLFQGICNDFLTSCIKDERDRKLTRADPRGDEGLCMIYCCKFGARSSELADHIDTLVLVALELKRQWLASDFNRKRVKQGLLPVDLGVGIQTGPT